MNKIIGASSQAVLLDNVGEVIKNHFTNSCLDRYPLHGRYDFLLINHKWSIASFDVAYEDSLRLMEKDDSFRQFLLRLITEGWKPFPITGEFNVNQTVL